MKSINKMSGSELAAFIQDHLKMKGIDVILSGGACVTYYSQSQYVSMDLDLINIHFAKRREIKKAMQEIDFIAKNRYYKHNETDFFIEFPPGPLAIGEEPVHKIENVKLSTGTLRIISPTDCVKDRLAAYYHWDDLQALEQACLVANQNDIDLKEIERWSIVEDKIAEFNHFINKLNEQLL